MVCVQFVGQSHTSDWIVAKDTREDTVAHFSPQGHRFNCNSPYRHWVQAVDRKGGSRTDVDVGSRSMSPSARETIPTQLSKSSMVTDDP